MAKLCSSYSLCPLIEQKNFLGVSDDGLSGCVIVTLGRNIVIRYRLSDQKQVSSWSSKDKPTAPVVYDSVNRQYIGVFNGDQVAFWGESSVLLDKPKKFKFVLLIHSVLTAPGIEPVVIYKNGCVAPLISELEFRKNPQCDFNLPSEQNLEDAKIINLGGISYVYIFARTYSKECWLHFVPVDADRGEKYEFKLDRGEGLTLVAYTVTDIDVNQIITLWSDGKVFSLDLPLTSKGKFPGRFISVLEGINPKLPAAMVPVSSVHVAVYGADINSEGAVLVLFNICFGLVQCGSHMKMYSMPPRLWRSGQSQLVLVMGQFLAVAPYRLSIPRLSTLVASHAAGTATSTPPPPLVESKWSNRKKKNKKSLTSNETGSNKLSAKINKLLANGLTEMAVCEELFPNLLETEDALGLSQMVKTLTDIPELWLVKTIVFCLGNLPERRELLRKTMDVSLINDANTLRLVRNFLSLSSVLTLIWEICHAMEECPGNPHFIEWAILLLDSHYQQYLLSMDEEVIKVLTTVKGVVADHLGYMRELQKLNAQLLRLQRGKGILKKPLMCIKRYLIEEFQLYET